MKPVFLKRSTYTHTIAPYLQHEIIRQFSRNYTPQQHSYVNSQWTIIHSVPPPRKKTHCRTISRRANPVISTSHWTVLHITWRNRRNNIPQTKHLTSFTSSLSPAGSIAGYVQFWKRYFSVFNPLHFYILAMHFPKPLFILSPETLQLATLNSQFNCVTNILLLTHVSPSYHEFYVT